MNIRLENLRKSYLDAERELTVIQSLSYEFSPAQSVAIVGRSGVGKSTLLHLLGCLDRPSAGRIFFDGTDLAEISDDKLTDFRGSTVGFIFQFHHLLPEFTAVENVAMPLLIAGEQHTTASAAAREILARVGLQSRLTHRPGQLSGGEQQRVSVARALVRKPAVVLADEPTGNLDRENAGEVERLLVELHKSHGSTLIVATHNMDLARSLDVTVHMGPGGTLS